MDHSTSKLSAGSLFRHLAVAGGVILLSLSLFKANDHPEVTSASENAPAKRAAKNAKASTSALTGLNLSMLTAAYMVATKAEANVTQSEDRPTSSEDLVPVAVSPAPDTSETPVAATPPVAASPAPDTSETLVAATQPVAVSPAPDTSETPVAATQPVAVSPAPDTSETPVAATPPVAVSPAPDTSETPVAAQEPVAVSPDPAETPVTAPEPAPVPADDESQNKLPPLDVSGTDATTVVAGRVSVLSATDREVSAIEVVEGPAYGRLTVNADNTLALVLTGSNQTADLQAKIRITEADGSTHVETITFDVVAGTQAKGWGLGDFYMLATDENDNVVVEPGSNHRKVYISGSDDALSRADIAALEKIRPSDVTVGFLMANPEYGGSPEKALAADIGMVLWTQITDHKRAPTSNWLLFEAGYEYSDLKPLLKPKTIGESELHPIYIGAYGAGEKPVIADTQVLYPGGNIVVRDLEFTDALKFMAGKNILAEDIDITANEMAIKDVDGFTLRHSDVIDVIREESNSAHKGQWGAHNDRISGVFANGVDGLLLEHLLVDHVGWADDYDPALSLDGGQPPSIYSQNLYLSWGNGDVTLRDSILMRAAAFGAQVRSGGVIEDNLFLDNNAALNSLGGKKGQGNYSLISGNVVTSGAHKKAEGPDGALTLGIDNGGSMSTLVGNIVAHLFDPNSKTELKEKYVGHSAVKNAKDVVYDDTIKHNWYGYRQIERKHDLSSSNLVETDPEVLNQTTIQLFAADLLDKKGATIEDLAQYLRAQADGKLDEVVDADVIIAFFREGFGLETDLRADATELRFTPDALGDGVRWDNRMNWSTEDLPGTRDGDSVDLGGNWVRYGGTTTLAGLDFGAGGQLDVTQGRLHVEGDLAAGEAGGVLLVDRAGQFWFDGYDGDEALTVRAGGGRLVNTAEVTGRIDLTVSDNAQVILATDEASYFVGAGSALSLHGGDVRVGFDGPQGGMATLGFDEGATLRFKARNDNLGQIGEFDSGAFGATDMITGVNLGGVSLEIDVTGIGARGDIWTLVHADELVGALGNVSLDGLGNDRNAELRIDYDSDSFLLKLGDAGRGSGATTVTTVGDPANAQSNAPLWEELTHYDLM